MSNITAAGTPAPCATGRCPLARSGGGRLRTELDCPVCALDHMLAEADDAVAQLAKQRRPGADANEVVRRLAVTVAELDDISLSVQLVRSAIAAADR